MKTFLLAIKGFFIGLANIIPGVSGGTLAIILGIYEKLIDILSAFWKNFLQNIKFLLPIIIGAGIAIISGAFLIGWGLEKFPVATSMFFIGLVIGGLPFLYKHLHKKYSIVNVLIFIIIAALVVLFSLLSNERIVSFEKIDFLLVMKLTAIGVIASATMIIPGISGSLVLMNLGYYAGILNALKGLTSLASFWHSVAILTPFGIGLIIGIILIARLIKFLLNKFPTQTYFAIFGFVIASIFGIIYSIQGKFVILELIVGFLLLFGGAVLTFFIAKYDNKNENEETEDKEKMID